jgi:hypothetical protein
VNGTVTVWLWPLAESEVTTDAESFEAGALFSSLSPHPPNTKSDNTISPLTVIRLIRKFIDIPFVVCFEYANSQ